MKPNVTETLLQAAVFDVQHWTPHDTPLGTIEREIVVHPGGVVMIPLRSEGEIVMAHNLRPAGTREHGKTIAALSIYRLQEGQL